MTDTNLKFPFGILQFSKFEVPDRSSGYTLDDNARALIITSQMAAESEEAANLARIYLGFIQNAQKEDDGRFHNVFSEGGEPTEEEGSLDSFGRTMWALGTAYEHMGHDQLSRNVILEITDKAKRHIGKVRNSKYLRSKAFILLGWSEFDSASVMDIGPHQNIVYLANSLVHSFEQSSSKDKDWKWFENKLTYSNARLPQALLRAYQATKCDSFLKTGLEALDFLTENVWEDEVFVPIGNGWYPKGGKRARYDQQPVDVGAAVECYVDAYRITGEMKYLQMAEGAFEWFNGRNSEGEKMYDSRDGRVYDGLEQGSVNQNKGAESLLAYMMADLKLRNISKNTVALT